MNQLVMNCFSLASFFLYFAAIIAAITMPIWGYKLFEKKVLNKHTALELSGANAAARSGIGQSVTSIVASIGTTSAGVFLIQSLPLVFNMIDDVAGHFAVNAVYGDFIDGSIGAAGSGDFVDQFYGLTAQLSDILQTSAPMAAVGLGGYNLINNLSRGLPAITKSFWNKK